VKQENDTCVCLNENLFIFLVFVKSDLEIKLKTLDPPRAS